MKQDTQSKFAAILAAAQAKTANKVQPNFAPVSPQKPEPIPETKQPDPITAALVKMVSFTIIWQEGSGKFDGKVFTTWNTANDAMTRIYKEHSGQGYSKVKINVKWENGQEITDRADCSDSAGDFCPNRSTIGEYLKKHNSAMYASNLQVGDRANLSFEDIYLNTTELQAASLPEFLASPNFVNDAAQDETDAPELSTITIADLLNDTLEPKAAVKIVDYSVKAFAVIGETKAIKEVLRSLGGRFNNFLTCGPGWIFAKTRYEAVKTSLSL